MVQSHQGKHLKQIVHDISAIDAITCYLQAQLEEETGLTFYVKNPEEFQKSCQIGDFAGSLIIFFCGAPIRPSVKPAQDHLAKEHLQEHLQEYLKEQSQAPHFGVLKYVMTALDQDGKSNTPQAHMMLSQAAMALHQVSFAALSSFSAPAHTEDLKVTFEEVSSKFLSRLFQCSSNKYRFSLGFQVGPVAVAPPNKNET